MKIESLNRLFSFVAGLSLLVNSLATPLSAYAQTATPTDTPTAAPVGTSTPAPTVTATPTDSPTVAPTATDTATPIDTSTPIPVYTSTPTASPSDTPVVSSPSDSAPTTPGPPSNSPSSSPSTTPVATATGTTAPQVENGKIDATVLKNTSASSVNNFDVSVRTDGSATLTTNKTDYSPTDTVLITGAGFIANKTYTIEITSQDPPAVDFKDQVKADGKGDIIYSYQLDGTMRPNYTIYVKDGANIIATTTFTDPSIPVDFSQCANKNPTAGTCDWIGSILQTNNSSYFEGMSVPQRLLYRGIGNGVHTISFKYSYTKGGIHAYDFITGKNQGNGGFTPGITTFNDCQGLSGPDLTACNALVGGTEHFVSIPNDPFDSKDSAPGVGTGSTQTAKETTYGGRSISVFNTGTISSTSISPITHDVGADGDTGDSNAQVTFNFTLASCPGGACNLVLYFDGHLAVSGSDNTTGVNWGPGKGSSNINGGPYHIKDVNLDNSGGSLDNQIQGANIILPGTIVVTKNTTGGDGTFNFTSTGGSTLPGSFSITTSGGTGSQTYTNVNPGTYSVSETVPGGWTLSSSNCTNGTPGQFNVTGGQTTTCTFNDTKQQGNIKIIKNTTGGDGTFGFTITGPSSSTPSIVTSGGTGNTGLIAVNSGPYGVSETVPGGWSLTGSSCDSGTPASFNVGAGQTVTCTFNDTKLGTMIVKKVMNGGTDTFTFTGNPSGTINTNNGTVTVNNVTPGQYSSTESAKTGWTLDSILCNDNNSTGNTGTRTATFNVEAGETVTCTFTNSKLPTLTVNKVLSPSQDPGKFNLQIDGQTAGTGGNVGDGGTTGAQTESIGSHAVGETAGTGTSLSDYTSAISGDCDNQGNITLSAGQNKVCTITNTRNTGSVKVNKLLDSDGNGSFETSNPGSFNWSLDGSGTNAMGSTVTGVNTGTHSINENSVTNDHFVGWYRNSNQDASCLIPDSRSLPAAVDVFTGQTTEITICNARDTGTIRVIKDVIPNDSGATGWDFAIAGPTNNNADNLHDGDASNTFFSATGDYTVTEAAHTGTTLGNYTTEFSCVNGLIPVISGQGTVMGRTFPLGTGQNIVCTFTNTIRRGTVIVTKYLDDNADGIKQATESGLPGWDIKLDQTTKTTTASGQVEFDNLIPGSHFLSETIKPGWILSNISCDNEDFLIDNSNDHSVFVPAGNTINCFVGNFQKAHIIVIKDVVAPDGSPATDSAGLFDFHFRQGETIIDPFSLRDEESFSSAVTPGSYDVNEVLNNPDYTFAGCEAVYGNQSVGIIEEGGVKVTVGSNDTVTVTCTNKQKPGHVQGFKWNDLNGNGQFDCSFQGEFFTCEPKLSGWTIFADLNQNGQLDNGEPSTTTDNNGNYALSLNPGTYKICEVRQDGWAQTFPANCWNVTIGSNETFDDSVNFGNQEQAKGITIEKSNDKSGGTFAGDTVTYTLVITNTGNVTLNNVTITDALPGGFTYVSGSSTLDGSPIADPGIAGGVLTWNIGTLTGSQSKTLVYKANIASDLTDGTYKNFATCKAFTGRQIEVTELLLLGQEVDCNVADSSVPLGSGRNYGGNLTPQVLGAKTELPASGSDTALLVLALGIGLTGVIIKVTTRRRKYAKN